MKKHIFLIISAAALLTSCIHKELCYHHNEHAHKYHVMIDPEYRYEWEENCTDYIDWINNWPSNFRPYDELRPGKPAGLRVVNYPQSGGNKISNIPADGGIAYFSEGIHDILFYNNDTEYIVMSQVEKFATTRASTRTRTRASYAGNPFGTKNEEEVTVNAPDMLYGNFMTGYEAKRLPEPEVIEVTLHPLVFTYKIRFEFSKGLEYVALARGTLAGMAMSVNMSTGKTSDEAATILYECEVTDFGAKAYVNSFGIPGYPNSNYTKSGGAYAINLEVRMKNGKYKSFDFDVTEEIEKQPHGGVIVLTGLEISQDEGMSGSGAFDVVVDDWGEYEDIELPLM
jgi:hypothetical protein